jgi:hypothetical protein
MAETITLDPGVVALNRTEIDITGYVAAPEGVDWGDAAIQAFLADLIVGSTPVDYRLPNRMIKIPLRLQATPAMTFAQIRTSLQNKVGLIQREGGWLKRQLDSVPYYADLVNATLHLAGTWQAAFRSGDPDALLELECLGGDFYGDEVALDSITATSVVNQKLQLSASDALIAGNHYGRTRIIVTNPAADQRGLIWGLRSRRYDPAATAALFYEAEGRTPLSGAAVYTQAGSSGGGTNNSLRLASLVANAWLPIMSTQASGAGAQLTHVGSYRVWARCQSPTRPRLKLSWALGNLATVIDNDPVRLPATVNSYYMLDLGTVLLQQPRVGTPQWQGVISAMADVDGDSVIVDAIYLQPLDESAGVCSAGPVVPALSNIARGPNSPLTSANDAGYAGTAWQLPSYEPGYVNLVAGTNSQYLKLTNLGFNLPSTATVVGVRVEVDRYSDSVSGPFVKDSRVRLVKAGTVQATDRADLVTGWPTATTTAVYGGSTDAWGGGWLYSDINNAGFGVAIAIANSGATTHFGVVTAVRITAYFTLPGGFAVSSEAVVYSTRTAEVRTDGAYRTDSAGGPYGPIRMVKGDLPRIPPSGSEARPVELFARASRGNLIDEADSSLDAFTVQVRYQPSFLFHN